jgi:hypothetical protein
VAKEAEEAQKVTDVLIYWRDYRKNAEHPTWNWNTNARFLTKLKPGDRLWFVTSGKILRLSPEHAGFLVATWPVKEVIKNPDDDPAYPPEKYGHRIVADIGQLVTFRDPVLVDHIVRPAGCDAGESIGRFLQKPRRLDEEKVRLLRSAAAPELVL